MFLCAANREIGPRHETDGFPAEFRQISNAFRFPLSAFRFSAGVSAFFTRLPCQQVAEKPGRLLPLLWKSAPVRSEMAGFRRIADDFHSNTNPEALFSRLLKAEGVSKHGSDAAQGNDALHDDTCIRVDVRKWPEVGLRGIPFYVLVTKASSDTPSAGVSMRRGRNGSGSSPPGRSPSRSRPGISAGCCARTPACHGVPLGIIRDEGDASRPTREKA